MVWQASSRANFVDDVQAMRRRVEQHIPPAEADRQLKLGPGGLRDVEFSVQLLQLVHGRADETLRTGTTLDGLAALSAGGYVGRDDAATLGTAYRLLRTLEHRIQLFRLRRTHLMPTAESDLRRLGRALGHRSSPAEAVVTQWRAQQREVRRLHERIFYRPLLSAVARLSDSDVRLTPEAARERLSALGFRDPRGALRHLEALTEGISRRAAIQRQLLPVMLGWFADEADPDAGLLAFRKISDELGSTHWYLRLLRDEGSAAERLAHTLARSRFAADLLEQAPECVQFLGDSAGLQPRSRDDLLRRMRSAAGRKDDPASAVLAARTIRRSELFRVAVADLTGGLTLDALGQAMTDLTAALLEVTLEVCVRDLEQRTGAPALTRLLIVGMGRLGGAEQGYGSDADVVFVHDPVEGADEGEAQTQALEVVKELIRILGLRGPDPDLDVDASLRPEGKSGPLVRSLESYRQYYDRWSLVWEAQALLRATPVAGDPGLAERYLALIAPIRWPEGGLDGGQVREIRTLKARMEAERLPRGADRKTHFKLGHGGLSDVEWVVQLVQLRHAHAHPELRTASHDGRARGCRAARPGRCRARGRPRRRLAAGLLDAQRRRAVPGQVARCRAHRPARRRRHRPHPGPSGGLGLRARGALPAGGAPGPRGARGRALRRLIRRRPDTLPVDAAQGQNGPMFISGVGEDVAQGDVAEYYEGQRAAWGFLPNYAPAFSSRPDVARAWNALNLAVRGGMDRRRFEIATIAAARARRSTYCTAAHSAFLRDVCGDEAAMASIAEHPDGAALSEQDRAVYRFAGKVAADAASVDQDDVDSLRAAGLGDAEVADVVFAAAARCFFTAVLDGLGTQLDAQTAQGFPPALLESMVVGRPVAVSPGTDGSAG